MNVELTAVTEDHKDVLANLLQFYRYEFSEFRGYELTPHGTFVYRYLDHYFTDDDREACLITASGQLAGFAMTRLLSDGARMMAEFFIVRRHRRPWRGPLRRAPDAAAASRAVVPQLRSR
jgi:predicted acetyltransferase